MIDRRQFLGVAAGAGAALALTPALLRALQQPGGKIIQRAIPSSGERIPVIGLGSSATFSQVARGEDRSARSVPSYTAPSLRIARCERTLRASA